MSGTDSQADPSRQRQGAESIVRRLQEAGHVAYFAGGCVRDELIGHAPADYDVATDAHPQQVQRLFGSAHFVGEAFGVVLVRKGSFEYQVATFRSEGDYSDGRRPDSVRFTGAREDAARRDFTINGLFYDPVSGRVIDHVDGQTDLQRGVIRAIGDPSERFGEDYLRILRAVRFAARLGYRIDPATTAALEACGPNLRSISRERIGGELRLMLEHRSAAEAVELIQRYGLDGPVLDEPPSDAPPKLLRAVVAAEAAPFELSLAAWSIDRHLDGSDPESLDLWLENLELFKPRALARRWRRALMLSNRQHDRLESLCVRFSDGLNWQALTVAARKRLMAEPIWPMLLRLIRAAVEERGARPFDLESFAQQQRLYQDQGVRPDPLIDGHHLIEAGLKPGPRFKSILEKVYDAQLEGTVTDRDAALKMALELT